jgi:Peptidase C13 family
MMQFLSFVCLLVLINLSSHPAFAQIPSIPSFPDREGQNLTWKVALMTGDDELDVFDNARKTLRNVFVQDGVAPGNIRELSMSRADRVRGVLASSASGLARALQDLSVGDRDACLIHMTSHGSPQGFYLKNTTSITPSALNRILERNCGDRPTVVLISACYSGVFVGRTMLKPNRIILTAARSDRTSFGCSAEEQYTYWDGCLIDSLPKADTWKSLYGTIEGCVTTKESKGKFRPSFPQAYFGEQVSDLRIPSAAVKHLVNFQSESFNLDGTYRPWIQSSSSNWLDFTFPWNCVSRSAAMRPDRDRRSQRSIRVGLEACGRKRLGACFETRHD